MRPQSSIPGIPITFVIYAMLLVIFFPIFIGWVPFVTPSTPAAAAPTKVIVRCEKKTTYADGSVWKRDVPVLECAE